MTLSPKALLIAAASLAAMGFAMTASAQEVKQEIIVIGAVSGVATPAGRDQSAPALPVVYDDEQTQAGSAKTNDGSAPGSDLGHAVEAE